MGHGPCLFKETDVQRAVRASRKVGIEPAAIRYHKDGSIEIVAGGKPGAANGGANINEWDEVFPEGI